ncbi:MAG: DUF3761 domain-containing protein [Pseudonocardiaceae bacterium]|jgi:hypothetical protein
MNKPRTRMSRTYERDHMSPIGSRRHSRGVLPALLTLFIGGASIAGCQNGTATGSPDPQSSTQVSSSSAAPLPGSTPLETAAPPPLPPRASAPRIAAVDPPSAGSAQESVSCDGDHYRNSDGTCVLRPQQAAAAPAGATARCSDGAYSFSQHRRGTCSGHGGVAQWL